MLETLNLVRKGGFFSDKTVFTIYADLESLIKKIDWCRNNPEKSCTVKVIEHIPSGLSMPSISSFKKNGK